MATPGELIEELDDVPAYVPIELPGFVPQEQPPEPVLVPLTPNRKEDYNAMS